MSVTLQRKLPILPGGRIIVPGTEPSTTVTSVTLDAEIRKLGIPVPSMIMAKDALALIPGSKILLLENFGAPTEQVFVFPENDISCPCPENVDYYKILLDNARPATEDELDEIMNNECGVLQNYDLIYGS